MPPVIASRVASLLGDKHPSLPCAEVITQFPRPVRAPHQVSVRATPRGTFQRLPHCRERCCRTSKR